MVAAGTVGRALNAVGGTLHGDVLCAEGAVAVTVDNVVERALRLLAKTQLDGGLTQAVYAAIEAYGLVQVGEAAVDTAGDVDQCGIDEVDSLSTLEVVGRAVERERGELMSVHVALYQVVADGHGNLELAVGIAVNAFLRLHQRAVNHELNAVHGNVSVQVGHLTTHGERRHVGEVVAVERQRAVADEAVARQGRELMDAACRRDGVGGAAAHEGYAADDVLTVLVGHGIAR